MVHRTKTCLVEGVNEEPALEEETVPIRGMVSAVFTLPPAPLITSAETPANTGLDETEEQPEPSPEPDSAVVADGAEANSPTKGLDNVHGLKEDIVIIGETVFAVITPPPAPLTSSAEPPANTSMLNSFNSSIVVSEEQHSAQRQLQLHPQLLSPVWNLLPSLLSRRV